MEKISMSENVIVMEDVYKAFGGKPVHCGINFSVRRGEIFTILGESGVGKSVLLKEITGLIKPDKGKVVILGKDTLGMTERQLLKIRKEIGMLFQHSALFDSLTVFENISYPLIENSDLSPQRIEEEVAYNLELVDLPGIEGKYPGELSGGMKKRVALARAIATRPQILLYDEPTAGLDPPNVRRIVGIIESMRDRLGITGVVITHDIGAAFEVSDRIAFLDEGKITFTGTVAEAEITTIIHFRNFLDAKF